MPIPIYTSSPISAFGGSTPRPRGDVAHQHASVPTCTPTPAARTRKSYSGAQQGASIEPGSPVAPSAAGTQQQHDYPSPFTPGRPTATMNTSTPSAAASTPRTLADNLGYTPTAFPQPGTLPTPPSWKSEQARKASLPPPPKAGEVARMKKLSLPVSALLPPSHQEYQSSQQYQAPQQTAYTLVVPGPTPEYPTNSARDRGRSAANDHYRPLAATSEGDENEHRADSLSHPPGYQQNTQAAEFSSNQRAAYEETQHHRSGQPDYQDDDGDGIWSTAKKWAVEAGETLSAAESEVWRRINKE